MKKIFFLAALINFSLLSIAQSVKSPQEFLGYKIGTKFTRHDKIVSYFKSIAQSKPDMVKIEKYGETTEGRELMVACISSPENINQLENIRKNNLRLSGLLKDNNQSNSNTPAIVWLSYNVHGNEPSSSEAAMMVLYELINPSNQQTKEWLKNTVVIIDPCINPDGRDRYVNWYNSVVGKNYNADNQSREHNEPWPGGRSNHYNFDMNRDWAWQTQFESVQRMKKYNEWMPQIHVDFHEQGVNEPYYFAPAAEPLHEVITQWQRDFQITIGKNNAKYFDDNGWLYFTKERFDLFYPSYGDTYPLYNGAIGMTYEQGGHSRGGLGITTNNGDTLTLVDRAMHHYTTSLSTIEVASKNTQKIIDEYKKYFDDNNNAKTADYKTYIVTSDDNNKIKAVADLLNKNGIAYGTVSGKVKGYRYFTGKEEEVQLNNFTLAVSMYQPKSSLVRVLFEPSSKLSDSATYDITAWSIPFVYGVEGIALKEKKDLSALVFNDVKADITKSTYGYLIPYTSFNSAKLLAYLLKNNVKVRYADKPFTYNNKPYAIGTLIVLKTSNNKINWNDIVVKAAQQFNIQPDVVSTGFVDKGADFGSPDVHSISVPKIAMLTGEGVSSTDAGEVWNLFDAQLDYPITLINANDLARANLKNYNVLILPDGGYRSLNEKNISDKLKDFVRSGGKLIAMQGAVSQLANGDWGIKAKSSSSDDAKGDYVLLKKYVDREREDLSNSVAGAIYKVELDNTHPLAYGYPNYYYTLKQDANVYEFMKDGWNVGVLKKDGYTAGFTGVKTKSKLKDGLLFGVQDMGSGSIVYLADNPLFRLFWENGKLLFCNAVFLVGE
jgi:hypothetical protein